MDVGVNFLLSSTGTWSRPGSASSAGQLPPSSRPPSAMRSLSASLKRTSAIPEGLPCTSCDNVEGIPADDNTLHVTRKTEQRRYQQQQQQQQLQTQQQQQQQQQRMQVQQQQQQQQQEQQRRSGGRSAPVAACS
ncbi:MAG: hypothetical protein WDW38_008879 [Sanguina aurantia]